MRNLASIQRILKLEPIDNADAIEKATVLGWELVVKKGEFNPGELCVYCEIDSVLPDRPEFEFLRERKFRIKTIKLRGQVSQGICFPIDILPQGTKIDEGLDVTDILGVEKWEPNDDNRKDPKQSGKLVLPNWYPKFVVRFILGHKRIRNYFKNNSGNKTFPSFVPKTDETRVQVLQPLLTKYKNTWCYVTEKLDGSSMTVYLYKGKFGVCSRNVDLKKDKNNKFWKVALDHDLESKMRKFFGKQSVVLQGELIGPGVQGNKYKLQEHDIYFFNVFDPVKFAYLGADDLVFICNKLREKTVPILDKIYDLEDNIPKLVEMSKGISVLSDIYREGIVIRPVYEYEEHDLNVNLVKNRVSFKVVNPDFLIKYGE